MLNSLFDNGGTDRKIAIGPNTYLLIDFSLQESLYFRQYIRTPIP